MVKEHHSFFAKTRAIFLASRLLNTPFWTIFNLLSLILYKELGATPFQIALAIALKPAASLVSPYWSSHIHRRPENLRSNLIFANIFKYLPFLFFPWMESVWFFIFAFGFYMIFARGVVPAWMEILKRKVSGSNREKLCALGSLVDYVGGGILPLAAGWLLDGYQDAWRWLFFGTALLGVLSTPLFLLLPLNQEESLTDNSNKTEVSTLFKPWIETYALLRARPDFFKFQLGFMMGGAALMIIQPVLPSFFIDRLGLSYTKIAVAIALCKGVGFALSSSYWVKGYGTSHLFRFSSLVTLVSAAFLLILLFTPLSLALLYLAFLVYGVMQAGSELVWNMSGIAFAKEKESSPFSTTNVLTVGVRGSIAPFLGSLFLSTLGSIPALIIALVLTLGATLSLYLYSRRTSLYSAEYSI